MARLPTKLPQEARFATCRSMGHEWHHQPPIGVDGETNGWAKPFGGSMSAVGLGSMCGMCGSERLRWILRSGEMLPYRYRHPDGYATHGDERMTLSEWRTTHISSLFPNFLAKRAQPKLVTASSIAVAS
jgi:hypothetical protein